MGCDYYEHETTTITFNDGTGDIRYPSGFEKGYYPDSYDFDEEKFLEYTHKKIIYSNNVWNTKNYNSVYSHIGKLFHYQIKNIKKVYYAKDNKEYTDIIVLFSDNDEITINYSSTYLSEDILQIIDYTKKVEKVFENIEDFNKSGYSKVIHNINVYLGKKNFEVVDQIYVEIYRTER